MEVNPRKTQSISTNRHFCHRCETFLSGHFCFSELSQFNPRSMTGLLGVKYSEDKPRFYVDKMLLFLIPGITLVSRVIPS